MVLKYTLVLGLIVAASCHPTLYKRNEEDILEADMVAVSSTVIPLPVYEVGYGLGGIGGKYPLKRYNSKVQKPDEEIKLITIHTKKAAAIEKLEKASVKKE